jgi:GTP cyclohydrolase FolE2
MTVSVIPMTCCPCAATPTTPHELAAMQAHQAAENALSMALHYLRASASNVPGANRKAVQALAALNDLQALAPAGAGARVQISGRA